MKAALRWAKAWGTVASANGRLAAWCLVMLAAAAPGHAVADTFSSLFSFPAADGLKPSGALLLASDGNYYGVTSQGGSAGGYGTIFKLAPGGALTTLHSFAQSEGQAPQGPLLQGADGNFYGTTNSGGSTNAGTIFKMAPSGTLTVLHSFSGSDGALPSAGLVQGSDGSFYGVTQCGGASALCYGSVFRITAGGSFTALHFFDSSGGGGPMGALVQGADGNFYGTTNQSVFRISTSGSFTTLYTFAASPTTGAVAVNAGLALGADGNFYGATTTGGSANQGSIFMITPAGSLTTLHSLSGSDGKYPVSSLVLGGDGNFYGTTEGDAFFAGGMFPISDFGGVFRVATDGSFTPLYAFSGGADGGVPKSSLAPGAGGNFHGVTTVGGSSNSGTVFSITSAGAVSTLFDFTAPLGATPQGSLLIGADSTLYGTASVGGAGGGYGTAFKLGSDGSNASLLHAFGLSDGWFPYAGLIQGADGGLYGTTRGNEGPSVQNPQGTVFRVTTTGSFSSLYSFSGADGAAPAAPLLLGPDGRYYGTTSFGGSAAAGTVFAVDATGKLSTLHSFTLSGGDVGDPTAGLILGRDGNFYGATSTTVFSLTPSGAFATLAILGTPLGAGISGSLVQGTDGAFYGMAQQGGTGYGTIFKYAPATGLTLLHSFDGSDGGLPTGGLIAGYDGNFYGTSQGFDAGSGGTVFRVTPTGALTTLHTFSAQAGSGPLAGLALGSDGYLYGTTNGGGSAGIGTVFRLLQPPAAPTGLSAAPGDTIAKLSWNAAQGAVSYNILQGSTAGGEAPAPVVSGITGTSTTITGLSNGSTYYYTVQSVNAGGNSVSSNEASVEPIPPPAAPTGVAAAPGNAQVQLSWNAVQYAASYSVYQGTASGGEAAAPVMSGVTGTGITIGGLSNGVTYYFTIKAVNVVGVSPASSEVSATPIAPPPAPAGLAAVAGDGSVMLSWSAAARAASYAVYVGNSVGGESATPVLDGLTGTSVTVSGLANGSACYFVVRASNSGGTSPPSNEASATPQAPPSPPAGVVATAGNGQVRLVWTASSNAASYSIYLGTSAGGESGTAVQTGITATNTIVAGLNNGTAYYFLVVANGPGGVSAPSSEVSATPEPPPPPAPTGLAASAGDSQVSLSWNAASGATSYNIYQGTAAGGESATALQSGLTGTSLVVPGLDNGTTYYFVVRAVNGGGAGPASQEASATPVAPGHGGGAFAWPVVVLLGLFAALRRQRARLL